MVDVTTSTRTIAVTGASGLIGRHLCESFRRGGWRVRALMRDPSTYPFGERGIDRFLLRLPDAIDPESLAGVDVLVHAAYSTRGERGGEEAARRANEDGSLRLFDAARRRGSARIIFVSSLSARADAVSYYGRSKLRIEGELDAAKDLVLRPGLVLASDGGLAQRLWAFIARMHWAPVFAGGRQMVQPVHIDDLCDAFARAIDRNLTGAINVADPAGLPMRELLDAMARATRTRCLFVPLPAAPVAWALRAAESAGWRLPVSADSLLGLARMRPVDTRGDLAVLGIRLRSTLESIAQLALLMPFSRAAVPAPTARGG